MMRLSSLSWLRSPGDAFDLLDDALYPSVRAFVLPSCRNSSIWGHLLVQLETDDGWVGEMEAIVIARLGA